MIKLSTLKKNSGFTRTPKHGVAPKGGGFTLVETLVAITIFTMSILALLVILSGGIADTNYAKQKMTAAYLNQEGVEYIRNIRDTYVLYNASGAQAGWNAFKTALSNASCQTANGCYVDDSNPPNPITSIPITACGSSCPALVYSATNGRYGYTVGTASGFVRKINVTPISNDEIQISSTTYYTQGSGTYDIVFSENLFNWVQ